MTFDGSVRRYLHKMGWRWRRPRLDTARKLDPEAVSKLATLARAEALVLRPPHAPALPEGAEVEAIVLGRFGI